MPYGTCETEEHISSLRPCALGLPAGGQPHLHLGHLKLQLEHGSLQLPVSPLNVDDKRRTHRLG